MGTTNMCLSALCSFCLRCFQGDVSALRAPISDDAVHLDGEQVLTPTARACVRALEV